MKTSAKMISRVSNPACRTDSERSGDERRGGLCHRHDAAAMMAIGDMACEQNEKNGGNELRETDEAEVER